MPDEPKVDWISPNDPPSGGCAATGMLVVGMAVGFWVGGSLMFAGLMIPFGNKSWTPGWIPTVPSLVSFGVAAAALLSLRYAFRSQNQRSRFLLIGLLIGVCVAALMDGVCFYSSGPAMG